MMLLKNLTIPSAMTALVHRAQEYKAHWGPALHAGLHRPSPWIDSFTPSTWIRESNTTIVLPAVPSPVAMLLALWPGMETSCGDLIQSAAVSTDETNYGCGDRSNQLCVFASTFVDFNCATEGCGMIYGAKAAANEGDHVTMHYKYNDTTTAYDQTVLINGDVVSTLSTKSGHAYDWQLQVECQDAACSSTVEAHQYIDTVIKLNSPDVNYGDTVSYRKVLNPGLTTSDGGKTWSSRKITMEKAVTFH